MTNNLTFTFLVSCFLCANLNSVYAEPQTLPITSSSSLPVFQDFFNLEKYMPVQETTEMDAELTQIVPFWYSFLFKDEWSLGNSPKSSFMQIRNANSVGVEKRLMTMDKQNEGISFTGMNKLISTPENTTTLTINNKAAKKAEKVNIGEIMMILEEVGAGSVY